MASMSRTSTLMNLQELATTADAKPAENPIGFLPLEILPNEVYSLVSTTNYTMTPETTETKTSNLSELSWLFEILTSNITMITVSSIMAALLYHTLYSVSSSVQDFCFSSSPINTSPVPSPFAEETCSINSTDELMQWAELITPAVQPLLSKIYNFLIFPVAPIALSVVLAWNTPGSRRPSRLAEMSEDIAKDFSKAFQKVESKRPALLVSRPSLSTRRPSVVHITERRGSFMVQYDDDAEDSDDTETETETEIESPTETECQTTPFSPTAFSPVVWNTQASASSPTSFSPVAWNSQAARRRSSIRLAELSEDVEREFSHSGFSEPRPSLVQRPSIVRIAERRGSWVVQYDEAEL